MIISIMFFQSNNIKENWQGMPARTIRVDTVAQTADGTVSIRNPVLNQLSRDGGNDVLNNISKPDLQWVKRPSYQPQMATRFDSGNKYGANIRANPPANKNLGVTGNPLEAVKNSNCNGCGCNQQKTKEGYCVGCNKTSCGMTPNAVYQGGAATIKPGSSEGNFNKVRNDLLKSSSDINTSAELPVSSMRASASLGDDAGDMEQPIVFDRLIYANKNSRLRGHGDHIRGDLPIVPCKDGWFRPSVDPANDLHQGAMAVLGGDGSTQQGLAQIMYETTAGYDTTIGGVNMATQLSSDYSAALSDVSVTAFP
ncbi:MAG: hypothetical protein ACW98X_18150 [Promethearchaeota archaeon]